VLSAFLMRSQPQIPHGSPMDNKVRKHAAILTERYSVTCTAQTGRSTCSVLSALCSLPVGRTGRQGAFHAPRITIDGLVKKLNFTMKSMKDMKNDIIAL
jgi:hypothetical protein